MICKLCFETGEELINIDSPEGKEIAKIIYKYFPFCFEQDPNEGMVCQKCWLKVELFHEFYIRIEEIHSTLYNKNEIIFAECITNHLDITIDGNELKTKSSPVKIENENQSDDDDERNIDKFSDDSDYFPNDIIELPRTRSTNKHKGKGKKKSSEKKNILQIAKKEQHRQTMTSTGTFQCEMCKTHFLSNNNLQRHIKGIHLALEFKCAESRCVESFETVDQLNQHAIDNHSRQKCPHCNRMIKTTYYQSHIKVRHSACCEIVCDLCGKVSINKDSYKKHVRRVHEVQSKVQCDICGLWLKDKDILRSHMIVIHIQRPQTCPICGKVSKNKKAFTKHSEIHRDETKRHKCVVCDKAFRHSTKLKEHSYIHSGITDAYRCIYCDKTFRFGSSMYAHRKKEHPVEEQRRVNAR